jgi:hypothetical protein
MQSDPRIAWSALVVVAALVTAAPRAHAEERKIVTDGFTATAPKSPWKRLHPFDESGRVQFQVPAKEPGTTSLISLTTLALTEDTPRAAIEAQLATERALVRSDTDGRDGVDRSGFKADSMSAGGLTWKGFRVDVRSKAQRGTSWRWVALHPEFPRRRRVYRLAFDEYLPLKASAASTRLADARALAGSVKPHGRGWTAPLAEGFGDARVLTFAARIDSAMRLCWSEDRDAPPPMRALGYGPGLALEGDFFEVSTHATRDSLVDAAPTEYGTVFDRNGDGRCDLIVINRGVQSFPEDRLLPIIAAVADDDFDGKLDCAVIESADLDGDGKADHRLFVHDTNGDGSADVAIAFRDAVDSPEAKKVEVKGGVVSVRIAGQVAPQLTFDDVLGPESEHLVRLDAARRACALRPQTATSE